MIFLVDAKLIGLGACEEVGRSSFILDVGDKILLDRGVKLSPDLTEYPLPIKTNISAAVLSHAHFDHSGYIPDLYKDFKVLTYLTAPTLDLSRILWEDSLKIADRNGVPPPYSKFDIKNSDKFSFFVDYQKQIQITDSVSLELFDAGHILGSSLSKLNFGEKSFLYTGDFRPDETRLQKGADLDVGEVDYVMIESTYGDRNHPDRAEVEKKFVDSVRDVVESGGTALVPAFALGRSQEILDILFEYDVNLPIFFDGMGQKVGDVFLKYPKLLKNASFLSKAMRNATWVRNERIRRSATSEPSIIVTTSGMLQGGPILSYLKKFYNDPKTKIFLTGYQVDGTNGRTLLDNGVVDIDGEFVSIKCQVEKYDFSAHASQEEMLYSLKKWSPEKVILVHGDKDVMPIFKNTIEEELGISTSILKKDSPMKL